MTIVKITVLETSLKKDLAEEYAVPNLEPGGWMKEPGKVITCCNDGLRPVYFKLEATDEQAGPFLGRG